MMPANWAVGVLKVILHSFVAGLMKWREAYFSLCQFRHFKRILSV